MYEICNSVAEYIDDQKVIKRKRVGLALPFISVTQLLSKIQKTPTTTEE